MPHIVLLGDSIIDNAAYVQGGHAVIDHLQELLPAGWKTTLLAEDGSVTADVLKQLPKIPESATHAVISMGGNDALLNSNLLRQKVSVVGEAFALFSTVINKFQNDYRTVLEAVLKRGLSVAVCTVYDPKFEEAVFQNMAIMGLALFNNTIIKQATVAGLPIIDLRMVCNEKTDFANEIEPSIAGGKKIARIFSKVVAEHDFERNQSIIYS